LVGLELLHAVEDLLVVGGLELQKLYVMTGHAAWCVDPTHLTFFHQVVAHLTLPSSYHLQVRSGEVEPMAKARGGAAWHNAVRVGVRVRVSGC
jgi:hypothetical protein